MAQTILSRGLQNSTNPVLVNDNIHTMPSAQNNDGSIIIWGTSRLVDINQNNKNFFIFSLYNNKINRVMFPEYISYNHMFTFFKVEHLQEGDSPKTIFSLINMNYLQKHVTSFPNKLIKISHVAKTNFTL